MVTKAECMERGMVYVEPHPNGKGSYTKAYCRKKVKHEEKFEELPLRNESKFDIEPEEDDIIEPLDIHEDKKEMDMPTKEDLEGKSVKLPRSNLKNAKTILSDINNEDKVISRDLHKQDFEDIPHQAQRLEHDAEKEGKESDKLFESQKVKAREMYENIKKKISAREYNEKKKAIKHENKTTKKNISAEKKRIRHERQMERKNKKLSKLKNKHGGSGDSGDNDYGGE